MVRPESVLPRPRAQGTKASDDVISALRDDIASGRLPVASRLPTETELAQHYGVSKPTVREAIRALDTMGLIEVKHGSGAYVRGDGAFLVTTALHVMMQLERVGVVEAEDVRATLATQSARWAALRRTDDDIARLVEANEVLERLEADDIDDVIDAVVDFHEVLSKASHNALTSTIESALVRTVLHFQFKAMRVRGVSFWQARTSSFQPERRELVRAVIARDPDAAAEAMRRYLDHQRELLMSEPELAQLVFSDERALETATEMTAAMRRRS
jgi:GntR family transcriptional repressor for pyruvate dehydrogenase complex